MAERWRVGRTLGRTVYRMVGAEASKDDVCVGMLDSRELAAQFVAAMNPRVPTPDYPGAWVKLLGYIRQAEADGEDILPADLIRYMAELRHEALAPVREWRNKIMQGGDGRG